MPRWIRFAIVISVVASFVPLALIAMARFSTSSKPPLHLFLDMDQQNYYKAQSASPVLEDGTPLFADNRANRPPVPGTLAYGKALAVDFATGKPDAAGEDFIAGFPDGFRPTIDVLEQGRAQFDIYCSVCHGLTGYGDGMVARRADELEEGTWVPPTSLHDPSVIGRENGHLFNTITHGIRNMKGYGAQIAPEERWAIVSYIRALQRSQSATLDDVPQAERQRMLDERAQP